MASPGNRHCVSCIGTLSFPIGLRWEFLPRDASEQYMSVYLSVTSRSSIEMAK